MAFFSVNACTRLPCELLAQIFDEFINAGRKEYDMTQTHPDSLASVKISHVCQLWRDVALALPWLWSWIPADAPLPCVKTYLIRSNSYPITIFPGAVEPDSADGMTVDDDFLEIILDHCDRVERIELEFLTLTTVGPDDAAESIFTRLKTLALTVNDPSYGVLPFWLFPTIVAPQLTNLTLRTLSPSVYWALFRDTLRRLEVSDLEEPLDSQIWTNTLRQMPLLEEIILRNAVEEVFYDTAPEQQFEMPHLRRIELVDEYSHVPGLADLAQAIIPSGNCNLVIRGGSKQPGSYVDESYEFIFRSLSNCMKRQKDGVDQVPRSYALELSDYQFSLQAWMNEVDLSLHSAQCSSGDEGNTTHIAIPHPAIDVLFRATSETHQYADEESQALSPVYLGSLPLAHMVQLQILGLEGDATEWESLASADVRELVYTCHRPTALFDALSRATRTPSGQPLFPHLHSLVLRDVHWHNASLDGSYRDAAFSEELDAMLAARTALGVPINKLFISEPKHVDVREGKDLVWFERMEKEFVSFAWKESPVQSIL